MKKAIFLFTLFLLSPLLLLCQEKGAPFPSELNVTASGVEIRLAWKDTQSLEDEVYHIHRYSSPITVDNLVHAELIGTVPEGVQSFTDRPPGGSSWYYLVTAEDDRFHYPLVIPYGNASVEAVRISPMTLSRAQAVTISDLVARPVRDSIVISFVRDRDDRALSLYRSTLPITSADQLSQALLLTVLEEGQHSWSDKPIPGIPYYYAAVDRELLSYGKSADILYEGNYTSTPTQLSLVQFFDDPRLAYPIRRAPLPLLQLEKYYDDIPTLQLDFPEYQALNPQLEKKLLSFLNPTEVEVIFLPEPLILNEDRIDGTNSLENKLKKILGEYFLKNRFKQAERALLIMLSEGGTEKLVSRIHFYRGQCFYFLEDYQSAYLEFLLSRDDYYRDSQPWMEACLNQFL
ncbi:MAG: hypothetical protein PQJ60_10410 [Spirochaetales bacterium]|nr:hypothetical protein [Spirochaetales bacterium]